MARTKSFNLRTIFSTAWTYVKSYNLSFSEALKKSWAYAKLMKGFAVKTMKFVFEKVDGTLRQAYGTLRTDLVPATRESRRPNDTVQVYYDTEKGAWRSFKKINLVRVEA